MLWYVWGLDDLLRHGHVDRAALAIAAELVACVRRRLFDGPYYARPTPTRRGSRDYSCKRPVISMCPAPVCGVLLVFALGLALGYLN